EGRENRVTDRVRPDLHAPRGRLAGFVPAHSLKFAIRRAWNFDTQGRRHGVHKGGAVSPAQELGPFLDLRGCPLARRRIGEFVGEHGPIGKFEAGTFQGRVTESVFHPVTPEPIAAVEEPGDHENRGWNPEFLENRVGDLKKVPITIVDGHRQGLGGQRFSPGKRLSCLLHCYRRVALADVCTLTLQRGSTGKMVVRQNAQTVAIQPARHANSAAAAERHLGSGTEGACHHRLHYHIRRNDLNLAYNRDRVMPHSFPSPYQADFLRAFEAIGLAKVTEAIDIMDAEKLAARGEWARWPVPPPAGRLSRRKTAGVSGMACCPSHWPGCCCITRCAAWNGFASGPPLPTLAGSTWRLPA